LGEQADYWDTVGKAWQRNNRQALWRVHSDAVYSQLFGAWLPMNPVSRLLKTDLFDEACSAGLVPLLASRAHHVVGIDLSIVTAQAARRQHPGLKADRCDVRRLPFADGAFDAVVSNSTLDHFASLKDLVDGLVELSRVLRRGGQLLLSLDNLANPAIAVRNALPRRLLRCLRILVPYDVGATCGPRLMQRLLIEAGFEVAEIKAVMHHPSLAAVAVARLVQRHGSHEIQQRYLDLLGSLEGLSHWPTRFLTGHYVAAKAFKR
jgi:SAM-dependent methyltransferase